MPNDGSDHCGNCRHRGNSRRAPEREDTPMPVFCTIRNVEMRAPTWTHCANHFRDLKRPLGPIFASIDAHDRIPYHDDERPRAREVSRCRLCAGASRGGFGVELAHPLLGKLYFCGAAHYAHWWKQEHPAVVLLWDCDAPPPSREQATALEVTAMLDLARANLGIGERAGAREVLSEARRMATGSQRDEVDGLLASLER